MNFFITLFQDHGLLIQAVLGVLFFVSIMAICFIAFRRGAPSENAARSVLMFRRFYLVFSIGMTVYIVFRYHSVLGDILFTLF